MKYRKYDRLVLPDDMSRQSALIRRLELWDSRLDDMLASDHITARDIDAAKTLRIHQLICVIWLRRCTTPEETANDLSMSDFETAVNLAETISSVAGTRGQRSDLNSSTFLFDMEIVSPIYFVGVKCRHPQLRRRAIKVLSGTWRKVSAPNEKMCRVSETAPSEVTRCYLRSEIASHSAVTRHSDPLRPFLVSYIENSP